MSYLKGEVVKIDTKNLRSVIGKKITYLRNVDVDKTGRGYFFPRQGTITNVFNRQIELNDGYDYLRFREIAEIVLYEEQNKDS